MKRIKYLMCVLLLVVATFLLTGSVIYAATTTATIGGRRYSSLQKAVDAARSGQTIVLRRDITLTSPLKFEKSGSYTLHLNRHTIKTKGINYIWVTKGKVTFKKGTVKTANKSGTSILTITDSGSVTIESGTYKGFIQNGIGANKIKNGSLHILKGTFQQNEGFFIIQNFGKLVIDDGTFTNSHRNSYYSLIANLGNCTINGGTFSTCIREVFSTSSLSSGNGDITVINGGIFKRSYRPKYDSSGEYGFYSSGKKLKIKGGTFNIPLYIQGTTVTMTGGTIKAGHPVTVDTGYGGPVGSFKMTGGKIVAKSDFDGKYTSAIEGSNITLTGGNVTGGVTKKEIDEETGTVKSKTYYPVVLKDEYNTNVNVRRGVTLVNKGGGNNVGPVLRSYGGETYPL